MIYQTSIDQTGIAIFIMNGTGEEKQIPLFSSKPCDEANEIAKYIDGKKIHVFFTNNLLEYDILTELRRYEREHHGSISEEYMDQLASGFPFVEGYEKRVRMRCYL